MENLLTYEDFLLAIDQPLALIMAKTQSCTVCKPIHQRLLQLLENYPQIPAYTIDIAAVEEFRGQQLIFTVPTILIYSKKNELLRESRFVEFANIQRLLDLYLQSNE